MAVYKIVADDGPRGGWSKTLETGLNLIQAKKLLEMLEEVKEDHLNIEIAEEI